MIMPKRVPLPVLKIKHTLKVLCKQLHANTEIKEAKRVGLFSFPLLMNTKILFLEHLREKARLGIW